MLSRIILTILTLHSVCSQKPSPCPNILVYEPRNSETDRWYAVVTLSSGEQLRGIWLRITLDRPAELLGNLFGDATSSDNREFLIRSQNYILEAGTTTPVRFFVKYNAASIVPSVTEINLNGRSICPSAHPVYERTSERPTLQSRPSSSGSNGRPISSSGTSRPRATSSRPNTINTGTSRPLSGSSNRPSSSNTIATSNVRPTNNQASRPSNNFNTDNDNYNVGTSSVNRPVNSNTNTRPSSTSSNSNSNSDSYNVGSGSSSRPTSLNNNNRPSSASNNFNGVSSNHNRPGSSNNFNTGSDNLDNGNDYNQNGNNYNNRPVNIGSSFGNNREPEDPFEQNTGFNQGGGSSSGLSVNSESSDEFFAGDFSAVVNRPPSNPSTRPNVNRNQQCGTVAAQPRPLISYGQNTTPGQWPWHAALYHSKGIQLMYTCGGTLISTRHILTAAHCVTKPHTNKAINPQNILVYLGKYNLKKFGSEIQDKEVEDIYVHPDYNYTVYYNDIAILRLAEPAQITNYVRPVCLWDEIDDLNEIEGRQGTVVGWGFDHNRQLSTILMQAQMPIVSTLNCIYSNREFFSQFTSEKSFCAGFKNGTSVCNGDSGGGMVFPKRGTSGTNAVWQIRGLVSVGVALQGQGVCDPSQYIVFTDVAKHGDWIQQILSNYP